MPDVMRQLKCSAQLMLLGVVLLALTSPTYAEVPECEPAKYLMPDGSTLTKTRPPNYYTLDQSSDDSVCRPVLEALNEGLFEFCQRRGLFTAPEPLAYSQRIDPDSSDLLLKSKLSVQGEWMWLVSDKESGVARPVEVFNIDIDNDGELDGVYRTSGWRDAVAQQLLIIDKSNPEPEVESNKVSAKSWDQIFFHYNNGEKSVNLFETWGAERGTLLSKLYEIVHVNGSVYILAVRDVWWNKPTLKVSLYEFAPPKTLIRSLPKCEFSAPGPTKQRRGELVIFP